MDWDKFWTREGFKERRRYGETYKSISKDIARLIQRHGYKTILDVGCGSAEIIKIMARKFPEKHFTGYDISKLIVRKNKQTKIENLHFSVKSFSGLPNKKFDLIICFATLHYSKKPLEDIMKLLSCVNHKGSLIVNYPNKRDLKLIKERKVLRLVNYTQGYLEKRFSLMFQKKNLITLRQIKDLGYHVKTFRETQPGNKYIQIIKT